MQSSPVFSWNTSDVAVFNRKLAGLQYLSKWGKIGPLTMVAIDHKLETAICSLD